MKINSIPKLFRGLIILSLFAGFTTACGGEATTTSEAPQEVQAPVAEDKLSVDYWSSVIKNDPKWLDVVAKKASENGVSIEEMIKSDAEYMVQEEKKKRAAEGQ